MMMMMNWRVWYEVKVKESESQAAGEMNRKVDSREAMMHIKSNQIKFISDTKIQSPMKEVKQKVMYQQDKELH